jgi:hypothetical protein
MRWFAALVLAACASSSPSAPPAPATIPAALPKRPPADELVATMLTRLGNAAGCPASHRVWCVAAGGWADARPAELPADGVLVGVAVGLERDRPDADLLATDVTLTAFAVHDGKGIITDVPPENAAEQRVIAEAIAGIAKVLRGQASRVELASSLAGAVGGLRAGASYPLTRTPREWRMTGKADARIRRTAAGVWIAVEVPGEGPAGVYVSIYPGDWLEAKR